MATTVNVTFTPNPAGIREAGRIRGVREDLNLRALRVKSAAISTVHNRTFEYSRGLKIEAFNARGGVAGVRLTATAKYSATLEFGSRAHDIVAKPGSALFWAGARHPVKKVHHPRTAAQHILRNALRAAGK